MFNLPELPATFSYEMLFALIIAKIGGGYYLAVAHLTTQQEESSRSLTTENTSAMAELLHCRGMAHAQTLIELLYHLTRSR